MTAPLRIAICGSSHTNTTADLLLKQALKLADVITSYGFILAVANQTGFPLLVTKNARSNGTATIVFSGARDKKEHYEQFQEKTHNADMVIYTGFGRPGSELIMMRSVDAVIISEPDLHTERQINYAIENEIPIGFLSDHDEFNKYTDYKKSYYSKKPEELVHNLIESLR